MNPIKSKHIVIGLAVGFILFLFCWIGNYGYSYQHPGATTHGATHTLPSHLTFGSEHNYTNTSTRSYNPTNPTRNEILQTKVKGYREATYWGSEYPLDEEIRYQNDNEFDRFIGDSIHIPIMVLPSAESFSIVV